MIDLIKERELFEEAFKKSNITFNDSLCMIENSEQYYNDKANIGWEMWQASVNREYYILIPCEQLNQWGHMATYAQEYGCPECFEARGYAHSLACEINSYFEPNKQGEQ